VKSANNTLPETPPNDVTAGIDWARAGDSRHANPWAADLYRKAIARGHDHPYAVRILARAWLFVILKRPGFDAPSVTCGRPVGRHELLHSSWPRTPPVVSGRGGA